MKQLAPPARWLGLAGLLPVIAGTAVAWFDTSQDIRLIATAVTLLYGGLILSFIGGAWWGLASQAGMFQWGVFILSVIPSLYAWPAVAWSWLDASYAGSAWLLTAGFALTLPVDRLLMRHGTAPDWWLSLRLPLSLSMALLFLLLGLRFFYSSASVMMSPNA
ncbi:MAG: DUF3429 domain-containing protein [Pseudomonadota bacterium]